MLRPSALTMPMVIVWPTANGLPIAMTWSPMRRSELSPISIIGRSLASIFSSATSVGGSVPMTLASYSRSPSKATVIFVAFSTTWLLVRM